MTRVRRNWLLTSFALLAGVLSAGWGCGEAPRNEAPGSTFLALAPMTAAEAEEAGRLFEEAYAEALSGTDSNTPTQERLLRINWWVHSHLKHEKLEPPINLYRILKLRQGQCTISSRLFQMMVHRLDLETRSVALYCLPAQNGHTTAEVFFDGAWHFFDPHFGVVMTRDGLLSSEIASLEE